MTKWSNDYIKALPDSAFAYIANDGSRHLPYRTAEGKVSLPAVRDSLAELGDLQMGDTERTTVKDKLQGSLKASDAEDERMTFVNPTEILASSDEYRDKDGLPTRMMLLRAGTFNTSKYGEVPITASDLQQMADNFKQGIGMAGDGTTGIPVDYAHQSHLNAGAWIKDMAVENGNELWATDIEFTGSGKKAIVDKEYKMLSSDFYPAAFGEWVDAESGVRAKNVIVGAAFTNRPMFTGNQPVVTASDAPNGERQITKYVIADIKEQPMDINAIRVKAADDVTVQEQRFLQAHAGELSADERKKFEIVEASAAAAGDEGKPKVVQASSVKGNEGVVAIQASELKGLTDRVSALQASEESRLKASLETEVDKAIARGAIKADQKDDRVKRLMAAGEDDRKIMLDDLAARAADPALAATQGKGDADSDAQGGAAARTQVMAHAIELMKKSAKGGKPITIVEATALAKEQHPELVEAAAAEHRARITATDDQFAAAGVNRG
jgi:hypothetical protein